MFKLPSNVQYRVFDKYFKGSSGKYLIKDDQSYFVEVKKNRDSICEAIGADDIALLHQVHGADIYYAETSTQIDAEPKADAVYTDKKGVALAIQTADCVPVLISDKEGKVIGAAHCGWKSAFHDILAGLVSKMQDNGAQKFMAIIGPSIHQASYEVSKDYFDIFIKQSSDNMKFFIPSSKADHFMFDISAYVRWKLELLGISDIYHIYQDTYVNSDRYPSYRRHCHNGEGYNSSILSTIVMH